MAAKQSAGLTNLVAGNTEFAFDIFTELAKTSNGNIFFSPVSISMTLAMTYLGAKKSTAVQMKSSLKQSNLEDSELHSAFSEMAKYMKTDASSHYILNTANKIFARKDYAFLKEFSESTKKFYNSEAQNMDFAADAEGSRKIINKWVENQTANKIQELMGSGTINADTAMVLVNAIYFKGNWKDKFEPRATKPGDFQLGDGRKVKVDMMYSGEERNYGENSKLDCKIIELPYVHDDLSLFAILPNKIDGIGNLASKLNVKTLKELTSQMGKTDVNLHLPKFKLEDKFSLNEVLKNLGMSDMFARGKADFSGMDGSGNLFVSQVVHKSFIEVNEEGSEAAAATGVQIMLMCAKFPEQFNANHPFLFFIRDNRTQAILFLGRFAEPKS